MIDRQLNYGRAIITRYLQQSAPYQTVLDIGAGTGTDLKAARAVWKNCTAIAIEVYEPYVNQLQQAGFKVIRANIEKDQLPLDDVSIDVVIANQILEHTKEVFWIFHEISRVLSV
jgi:ubiquinone/menaquinone biosynthesis C-methylase UbiE